MSINWEQAAAFVTILGAISGFAFAIMRRWLRSEFVPHHEHSSLAARVNGIAESQRTAPGQEEFRRLGDRVREMESGVASLREAVDGTREGVRRVERNIELLLEHALKGDEK